MEKVEKVLSENTFHIKEKMESAPYADEWQALREQRQKEYERLVTMGRWGDLLDITNEIAKECSVKNTGVQQTEEYSPVSSLPTSSKGRV